MSKRDQPIVMEAKAITKRFGENYGSYPVLRIHDHAGKDIAGRIDGNKVAGRIPVPDMLAQMQRGLKAFAVSTTSYGSGATVTWLHGRDIKTWERPNRFTQRATITVVFGKIPA